MKCQNLGATVMRECPNQAVKAFRYTDLGRIHALENAKKHPRFHPAAWAMLIERLGKAYFYCAVHWDTKDKLDRLLQQGRVELIPKRIWAVYEVMES